MRKSNPSVKVIFLLVVVSIITFLGINFLRGNDLDIPWFTPTRYYAIFPRVGDLGIGSEVKLNGLVIGKVDRIDEVDADVSGVKVRFKMLRKVKIPVNSVAYIKGAFAGLGSSVLIIDRGNGPSLLVNNDTIPTMETPDSLRSGSLQEITSEILQGLKSFVEKQDSLRRDSLRLIK